MAVYDDQKTDSEAEQLRRITGITPDEESAMDREAYNGAADDMAEKNGMSKAELKKAENKAKEENKTTGSDTPKRSRLQRARGIFLGSRRRKTMSAAGMGITGLGIGSILLIGSFLPNFRTMNLVQTIENHMFGTTESIVDKETNNLLLRYVARKVMPGMITNHCTSTRINKTCAAKSDADTPVGRLYNTWRDARLENKLASKYGLEIQRQGNSFFLRSDNLQERIFLGDYTPDNSKVFENKVFSQMNRSDVRREVMHAFDNETLSKRVMYRFMVGSLLDKKYNIRRCIMACDSRDRAHDTLDAKKTAFKSWLNERVIAPRSEMYSLAMDCALSSFDCTGGDEIEKDGEHTNDFERDLRARLSDFRARYGQDSLDDLYKQSEDIRSKGIVEHIVGKLLGETTAKLASKAIPVFGWIDLAMNMTTAASKIGPALRMMSYLTYEQTAVAEYMLYRTAADEMKAGSTTGNLDATELDSINASLDADPNADQGGLPGEASPVYSAMTGVYNNPQKLALLPTASAASPNGVYGCNNDKPLQYPALACPEEQVGATSMVGSVANFISGIQNSPVYFLQNQLAGLWVKVMNWITGVVFWLPGKAAEIAINKAFPTLKQHIAEIAKSVTKSFVEVAVPSPYSDHTSAARYVQVAAAGADFAANDYNHIKLGGRRLSDKEASALRNEAEQDRRQTFEQQSFFARMFDINSQYSLANHLAMAIPTNITTGSRSLVATLLNPTSLLGSFATAMPGPHANAATLTTDPFGIPAYGWTDNDIAKLGDQEAYWKKNCTDLDAHNQAWGEKAVKNSTTEQYDNFTTNGCALIQAGVGAGGGIYDTNLLPEDAQSDTAAPVDTPPTASGNAQEIAKQILANKNITYQYDARQDVELAAAGQPGTNGATLNIKTLQIVWALGKAHKVVVSAFESHGSGHMANSAHYTGNAVDIAMLDGKYGYINITDYWSLIQPYASGAIFLQGDCPGAKTAPSGMNRQAGDVCNHQHIQF